MKVDVEFGDLPPMEECCNMCWQAEAGQPCPHCRGTQLTEFGRAVVGLVLKYLYIPAGWRYESDAKENLR
jgi:hypothetical protein